MLMAVRWTLRSLALLLILPLCSAAAQDEDAPPPAEAAEQQSAEDSEAPDDDNGSDESANDEDEPAEETAESQSGEANSSEEKPAEEKPAASEKPAEEKADDEEAPDEESDEESDEEAPAKPESPQKPEPRRLTGLGKIDGPELPGQPWRIHDLFRPRPPVVAPANVDLHVPPPSDAIVLFDGSSLDGWAHRDREDENAFIEPQWTVENGYFEIASGSGDLYTLDSFGSVQLHLEWAAPAEARGRAQGRGNSGIKFLGLYEVQILDSYNNRTYADGQAAAIYGQYPPEVNASRPPGKWQSYDIIFEIPQFDGDELVRPGYLTVLHNGILVHHRRELAGVTGMRSPGQYRPHRPAGPIMLQDHGSPTRFRNIWLRPLD